MLAVRWRDANKFFMFRIIILVNLKSCSSPAKTSIVKQIRCHVNQLRHSGAKGTCGLMRYIESRPGTVFERVMISLTEGLLV